MIVKFTVPKEIKLLNPSQDGAKHGRAFRRRRFVNVVLRLADGESGTCPPRFLRDTSLELNVFVGGDSDPEDRREVATIAQPVTLVSGETTWERFRLMADRDWCPDPDAEGPLPDDQGGRESLATLFYELTVKHQRADDLLPNMSFRRSRGTILCAPFRSAASAGE